MISKCSTILISLFISFFIILISVLPLTNNENKIYNISALTETPTSKINTQDNSSTFGNITKENNSTMPSPSLSYSNATYGIKIDYPSDWTIKEGGAATIFHNQSKTLNVVTEILAPIQSDYYNPEIGASHNSIRLIVEDYDTFGDFTNNNIKNYLAQK